MTHVDGGTACFPTRTFTVTVTNACGYAISTNVSYSWSADTTPPTIDCSSNIVITADPGQCTKSNVTFWVNATDNCAGSVKPRVALYGSAYPYLTSDVLGKLVQSGLFSQVDDHSVNCSVNPLPTLADLQQYDAAYYFNDCSLFGLDTLGNVFAGYLESGGGLVIACESFTAGGPTDGRGLEGLIVDRGYMPFTQGGFGGNATVLTMVKDSPTHPALAGVSSFSESSCSRHNTGISTTTGTDLVAHWSNGEPLIGSKQLLAGGRIVGLNFKSYSSAVDACYGWNSSTDGGKIMANALRWAAKGNVSVVCTPPSGSTFPVGTTTVNCLATDACGNTTNCTFTVTVVDTIPVIQCPTNIVVDCASDSGAFVNFTIPIGTNHCCPGQVFVSCDKPPGWFPIGVTTVTCTSYDLCSNTTQCSFTVTVSGHGSGNWKWAKKAGGTGTDSGNAVAVDNQGNVFVTGNYSNSMSFPGSGATLSGFGGNDIFLAKYDAFGILLWAVRAGGTGQDAGSGVAVDDNGNSYVTGQITGTATFQSTAGGPSRVATSAGGLDAFIAKYDSSGHCQWATTDGGTGSDYGSGIAVTADGNYVYITGGFTVSDVAQAFVRELIGGALMGGAVPPVISSATSPDPLQSAGGSAITVDSFGRVFVAGSYNRATTFGGPLPAAPPLSYSQCFLAGFNPGLSGAALWVGHGGHTAGSPASCNHVATGIAVSADPPGSTNFVCYLTAAFNGTANFGNNVFVSNTKITTENGVCPNGQPYDFLIAKFDANTGTPRWVISGDPHGVHGNSDDETRGIAVDQNGNPYVTGFLHPFTTNATPYVGDGSIVLVASYTVASGSLRWIRNATDGHGSPGLPDSHDIGLGIAVDRAGCVHVAGAFTEDLEFSPVGQPVQTLNSSPANVQDVFVAKMCSNCGCDTTAELAVNGSFEVTSPAVAPNSHNNGLDRITGVPGWTTTAGNTLEIWGNTELGLPASHGTNHMEIDANSNDQTVTQVVTNLSTNCPATFCFDYTGRFGLAGNTYNNDFTVTLSGGYSYSADLDPAIYSVGGWTNLCVSFTPTSPTLTIAFRGHPHYVNDVFTQGGAHIDNVSLTQCCPTTPCWPPAVLFIVKAGGNYVVTWSGPGHLEATDNLSFGWWVPFWEATSPFTTSATPGGYGFFRVVCP